MHVRLQVQTPITIYIYITIICTYIHKIHGFNVCISMHMSVRSHLRVLSRHPPFHVCKSRNCKKLGPHQPQLINLFAQGKQSPNHSSCLLCPLPRACPASSDTRHTNTSAKYCLYVLSSPTFFLFLFFFFFLKIFF